MNLPPTDDQTILLAISMLLAVLAGFLLGGGRLLSGRPKFLRSWVMFCWLASAAGPLFLLRARLPGIVVVTAANALLLFAGSSFWVGTRQLRGVAAPLWAWLAPPALWLAACTVPAFRDSFTGRALLASAMIAGMAWACAVELLLVPDTGETRRTARALAILALMLGAVMWLRFLVFLFWPRRIGVVQDIVALVGAVIFAAMGFAGLAVASSRAAAEEAAKRELLAVQAELDRTLARAPVAVFRGQIGRGGDYVQTYLSRGIELLTGWAWEELQARSGLFAIFDPAVAAQHEGWVGALLETGQFGGQCRLRRPDGRSLWVTMTLLVLSRGFDGSAEIVGFLADCTAERQHQEGLLRAARMEALGRLSAGVAHDFNNVLQALGGSLELASFALREGRPSVGDYLGVASAAVERGVSVVHRLLAFARRGTTALAPIDLGGTVGGVLDMLQPSFGASIRLHGTVSPDVPLVLADKGELEAVLVNLAANSRDAMPSGGSIWIGGEAVTITVTGAAAAGLAAGRYVRIFVRDDGEGIPPDVLPHVLEPFFTTKPPGKGTGLGLAMAQGFARSMGGALSVESEAGAGTTVSLWLRQVESVESLAEERGRDIAECGGSGG